MNTPNRIQHNEFVAGRAARPDSHHWNSQVEKKSQIPAHLRSFPRSCKPLPDEMVHKIAGSLDFRCITHFRLVCHQFREVAEDIWNFKKSISSKVVFPGSRSLMTGSSNLEKLRTSLHGAKNLPPRNLGKAIETLREKISKEI